MPKTLTPIEAHERIIEVGKTATPDTRVLTVFPVGKWVRQGDVQIDRIAKRNADWLPIIDRQLAPGTTQGSRHIIDAACTVRITRSPEARPIIRLRDGRIRLLGPQIHSDGRLLINHPEHAIMDLPPGDYQVSYQTDIRTQQAIRD